MKGKVLVAEDEETVREMLQDMLAEEGYEVAAAANGAEALAKMQEERFDVVMTDLRMPVMDGMELAERIHDLFPDTPVIILTAYGTLETAQKAMAHGACGYIVKPCDTLQIRQAVINVFYRRELLASLAERRILEKTQSTLQGTVQAMALALEARDPYTSLHQQRVALLACAIAKEMNLAQDEIAGIHMAALVHDLGKIYLPAEILSRPGRLSEVEFTMIKTHPQVGYNILKELEFSYPIALTVLQHHERIDGSGYPRGVHYEDIIPGVRILAVADVVEAMASHRPYRPALGVDKAMEEIWQKKGVLYDPAVAEACTRLFTEKGFKFE